MAQKSKELDRALSDMLLPLGFKKIPKTRYFIRLHGEGVIQCVRWYHEPRYTAQELEVTIESIYVDPDYLFRPYLSRHSFVRMGFGFSFGCTKYIYSEDEYIPSYIIREISEEQQLSEFRQQILPRLERWQSHKDVFLAIQGNEKAPWYGDTVMNLPWYRDGKELNLAMYLNLPDEAEKYMEGPITFLTYHPITGEERKSDDLGDSGLKEKAFFIEKKAYLKNGGTQFDVNRAQCYLQKCKEQNLYDYNRVLNGDCGNNGDYANKFFSDYINFENTFFDIARRGEHIPIKWGCDNSDL